MNDPYEQERLAAIDEEARGIISSDECQRLLSAIDKEEYADACQAGEEAREREMCSRGFC